MKKLPLYVLNLPSLPVNKRTTLDYVLDDAFFASFEQELILGGQVAVTLDVDRSDRLLTLRFHLAGAVRLVCDRSLDEFDQTLDAEETLHVRFGETTEELADDILQIGPETQAVPLAQHLFDYVATALPMKKLHPRFVTADAEADAAAGLAAELTDTRLIHSVSTDNESDDSPDADAAPQPPLDPRWAALRHLN